MGSSIQNTSQCFFVSFPSHLSLGQNSLFLPDRHKEPQNVFSALTKMVLDIVVLITIPIMLFAKICAVVRLMYCTLPLAAKYRHVILHCICLVKLIEHMIDFGSTKVVQCISNTMPHSFGIQY